MGQGNHYEGKHELAASLLSAAPNTACAALMPIPIACRCFREIENRKKGREQQQRLTKAA
jgi:hypothetical protein